MLPNVLISTICIQVFLFFFFFSFFFKNWKDLLTKALAKFRPSSIVFINAAFPHLTSIIRASMFSAAFFDTIDPNVTKYEYFLILNACGLLDYISRK